MWFCVWSFETSNDFHIRSFFNNRRGKNKAFPGAQAGTWLGMEIIILCVTLKYGGGNLWSPAKAF